MRQIYQDGYDIANGDFDLIQVFLFGAVLLWNLGSFHWRLNGMFLIAELIFCVAPFVSLVYWPFRPFQPNDCHSFASEWHVVSVGTLEHFDTNIINLPQHSVLTHGGQC